MNYWIVERAARKDGDSGVLIGISHGKVVYSYHRGDEMRFADQTSAERFKELARGAGLEQYDNMSSHFNSVHVVNG